MTMNIDFRQITCRLGGQNESFEELCCQLAHKSLPNDATFFRLNGAGGDGGIECYADTSDGKRIGWQAKYVFDVETLLVQAEKSFDTALKIHPELDRFILCFPFDLTGPTGRRGRSGIEKVNSWIQTQMLKAVEAGSNLIVEIWPAFALRSKMLEFDISGGLHAYFFDSYALSESWSREHLIKAKRLAGPRYTPELNIQTELNQWFSAFERGLEWAEYLTNLLNKCKKAGKKLIAAINRYSNDTLMSKWPEEIRGESQELSADIEELLDRLNNLLASEDTEIYKRYVSEIEMIISRLEVIEAHLVCELEELHGNGADSQHFRQYMAEYMVSFPAANLDNTRETLEAFKALSEWLKSPSCVLAYNQLFVLSGVAGSGKTHGVCDFAEKRIQHGRLTCVIYGHEFRNEPDPLIRLGELIGLSNTVTGRTVLDILNLAGEASGNPFLICIDGINETKPLSYWRSCLPAVLEAVKAYPFVRLCITCRSSYVPYCIPSCCDSDVVEHRGFQGVEFDAAKTFLNYYGMEALAVPVLQPEYSNPLYLKLLCETMRSRGMTRIPSGWYGIAQTIKIFLNEKERQFSLDHEISENAKVVTSALVAISRAIAESGDSVISWSQAERVINNSNPMSSRWNVIQWLIHSDLLIEDVQESSLLFETDGILRPAFERLGDFLIAFEISELVNRTGLDVSCEPKGVLFELCKNSQQVKRNYGILTALSTIAPEQFNGRELSNLVVGEESVHESLVKLGIQSFQSRNPISFNHETESLIYEALGDKHLSYDAMDSVLSMAWQSSELDAFWVDKLLKQKCFMERDAYWCGYLHNSYENRGIVRRLVDAAFELPVEAIEDSVSERWALLLCWFTAAADRRVKDLSSRAITEIFRVKTTIIPDVLKTTLRCDDDEVRERSLMSAYGALLVTNNKEVIRQVVEVLYGIYNDEPSAFDNALIRDHVRCIVELASYVRAFPTIYDPEWTMRSLSFEFQPANISEDQIDKLGQLLRFKPDEFYSDFYKYSMGCMRPWMHAQSKEEMGKWILHRIIHDFGYKGSGCERYDQLMLCKYGGGRAKPIWAERIAKKYQWIALYQLASKLHDVYDRKIDQWESEPLLSSMILLEERKHDPTIRMRKRPHEENTNAWWVNSSVKIEDSGNLSDREWVFQQNDIPTLEELLRTFSYKEENWRTLTSYRSWGRSKDESNWNESYRHVWMHIESYLIEEKDFAQACKDLSMRNYFGRWMPEGEKLLYGYAGEYPWAVAFNTELMDYGTDELPFWCEPSANEYFAEWEYDASIVENYTMLVPARSFFKKRKLWWNGKNGYGLEGKTVFMDPSVSENGPKTLLMLDEELKEFIRTSGLRICWTILGEKLIVGGSHDEITPRRTFSQFAYLDDQGQLQVCERMFFDN